MRVDSGSSIKYQRGSRKKSRPLPSTKRSSRGWQECQQNRQTVFRANRLAMKCRFSRIPKGSLPGRGKPVTDHPSTARRCAAGQALLKQGRTMQRKTVSASLRIQIMVDCPTCGALIDLLQPSDCSGCDHNDEGQVLCQAVGQKNWYEAHNEFAVSGVICSECSNIFNVEKLEW